MLVLQNLAATRWSTGKGNEQPQRSSRRPGGRQNRKVRRVSARASGQIHEDCVGFWPEPGSLLAYGREHFSWVAKFTS